MDNTTNVVFHPDVGTGGNEAMHDKDHLQHAASVNRRYDVLESMATPVQRGQRRRLWKLQKGCL